MIVRRLEVEVAFHEVDMVRLAHNATYFRWFEKGRLELIEEFIPYPWSIENNLATPVVSNQCDYLWPAFYRDKLIVTTRHQKVDRWSGRFVFFHSIVNKKNKKELCRGKSAVTLIELSSRRLLKTIPDEIWQRYLQLK